MQKSFLKFSPTAKHFKSLSVKGVAPSAGDMEKVEKDISPFFLLYSLDNTGESGAVKHKMNKQGMGRCAVHAD